MRVTTAALAARTAWAGWGGQVNWFPGHMKKTMDDVARLVARVDVVVDVRDARALSHTVSPPLAALEAAINNTPGVVDNGLFVGVAKEAYVGRSDGTVVHRQRVV